MIIGPEGRIPPIAPGGRRFKAETVKKPKGHEFNNPRNRPLKQVCILAPEARPTMLLYSNLQIRN